MKSLVWNGWLNLIPSMIPPGVFTMRSSKNAPIIFIMCIYITQNHSLEWNTELGSFTRMSVHSTFIKQTTLREDLHAFLYTCIFILNTLPAHSIVFNFIKQNNTHASELFHNVPILPNFYSPLHIMKLGTILSAAWWARKLLRQLNQ
jgi:hypothetical protein